MKTKMTQQQLNFDLKPEALKKQKKLDKVKKNISKELVCPLKDAATSLVFGKGNPDADLLIIGEAPGKNEDLQGLPFVGAAGKNLNKLLNTINLNLSDIYIANILKYRPPKNRDPTPAEIKNHTPYLIDQIKIIKPKVIATLGNFATKFVLSEFKVENMKKIEGISKLHGQPINLTIKNEKYIVIPLYHPAAMIYNRKLQKTIEQDIKIIKEYF